MDINDEIDMQDLKYKVKELQEKNEELQVELDITKEQLILSGVIVSEMRTSKEIIRLIELVSKIETEQSNKCVDMKLRDIVNTSFYRLEKVFNKQSI